MGQAEFYGPGLPGLNTQELIGKLVVLEGTDGVGRSTQISLLKLWLEAQGHAVMDTELTESALTGESLKRAKEGHTLGPMTMTLFYATDLADRLENIIIPAMRAGYIVLTDRYIYSLMVRAMVRGMDPEWVKKIYGFALKPDAVIYLKIDLPDLVPRVLHSTGFDFWESGMDLHMGENRYDSFCEYQKRVISHLNHMAEEYGFEVVDANRTIEEVSEDLKSRLTKLLDLGVSAPFPEERSKEKEKATPPKDKEPASSKEK